MDAVKRIMQITTKSRLIAEHVVGLMPREIVAEIEGSASLCEASEIYTAWLDSSKASIGGIDGD